jgi:hypothetical protein
MVNRPRGNPRHLIGIALLGLLLVLPPAGLAELRVELDRERVALGDSVGLTIEHAGGSGGAEPELAVLRGDFEILGRQQTTELSLIDGRVKQTVRWHFTIAPRRTGTLRLPPIPVGQEVTEPLTLEVREPDRGPARDRDFFLELEVTPERPYVQQQTRLTVRLFQGVDRPLEGSIQTPDLRNAVVKRLGRDQMGVQTRGERDYRVIERRYAVLPRASGSLTIPPIVFEGKVATQPRQGLMFQTGQPIRRETAEQTLTVRPPPEDFTGDWWLPVTELQLEESWTPEGTGDSGDAAPRRIQVGEALTRRIELRARGATGEQLPSLEAPEFPGLNAYPDQAETTTAVDDNGVTGRRIQPVAFVATQPGTFTLPAIRLPWWDVEAERLRHVALPARELIVEPPATPAGGNGSDTTEAGRLPPPAPEHLAAGALGLWLLTLAWALTLRRRLVRNGPAPPPRTPRARRHAMEAAREAFRHARRRRDWPKARAALLEWAGHRWPEEPPRNLRTLAARLEDAEAGAAVELLDRISFADARPRRLGWRAERRLEAALQRASESAPSAPRRAPRRAQGPGLPELDPR